MQAFQGFTLQGYALQNANFVGQGSYGKVFKVYSNKKNDYVALKQINMDKIRAQNLQELLYRQIKIMKELKSENTLQLIEYEVGNSYTYMILELCEEDLRNKMIKSPCRFPEPQVVEIFGNIVKGFKILVDHSCIHRDIKPENILIKNQVYKVADFGFACKADVYGSQKMMEFCGTPIYMAPQLLFGQPYNAKCDIWSLGLMLYELVYGATPWPVRCIENYKKILLKRPLAFPFNVKIGKQTKDFLKRSLVVNQDHRMSWEQFFEHPLVKDKVSGQKVSPKQVQFKIKKILSMMQREADRHFIDVIQVFNKYRTEKGLDYENFEKLLQQLNPTITTYEIKTLFKTGDQDKNGYVDEQQFQQLFCATNFRSDLFEERELDEIIGIIVQKKIDIGDLFDTFDKNQTKALDWKQFSEMIYVLAPKYRVDQIFTLHKILDYKKDGLIQKDEIIKVIGNQMLNKSNKQGIWMERAERNTKSLKIHLEDREMDAKAMLVTADLNIDHHIDLQEFIRLMGVIDFDISIIQAKEMFKFLDINGSSKISFQELQKFLK